MPRLGVLEAQWKFVFSSPASVRVEWEIFSAQPARPTFRFRPRAGGEEHRTVPVVIGDGVNAGDDSTGSGNYGHPLLVIGLAEADDVAVDRLLALNPLLNLAHALDEHEVVGGDEIFLLVSCPNALPYLILETLERPDRVIRGGLH